MREDIYRFRYQQAKIANSQSGDGYHQLDRDRYVPYPGVFFQDDFLERVDRASTTLAIDYLTQGKPLDAKEALDNIYHAHYLTEPDFDPFQSYLGFQKKWVEMMGIIEERRGEVQKGGFRLTSRTGDVFQIRAETSADLEGIQKVHRSAFNSPAEAHLVDMLRAGGKASISLLAEMSAEIAGHILFSPVSIDPPAPGWGALGLAPLGVIPERQRQGIGSALVNQGLERCRLLDIHLVVVLGDPAYYARFGFQLAIDHGLRNEYQADDHFMVLELIPGELAKFTGLVKYAAEFSESGT